jgi:oligopeptidase A
MDKNLNNPLLEPGPLPAFSEIQPRHVKPAVEQLISENREQIAVLSELPDHHWDNLIKPLELMNDRLDRAWSPVRHLNSVKSSPELRDAYNSCLPLLSEYSTEISQNHALYEGYPANSTA